MHKVLMCVSLLFNAVNLKENIKVEKIEYNSIENENIKLNIDIYSKKRDIVDLRVFTNDECNKFYSKALVVNEHMTTIARIPIVIDKNTVLKLEFYSNNLQKVFETVRLPVYKVIKKECNISDDIYCKSEVPTKVLYDGNLPKCCDKHFC